MKTPIAATRYTVCSTGCVYCVVYSQHDQCPPAVSNIDSHPAFRRPLRYIYSTVLLLLNFYSCALNNTIDYCNAQSALFIWLGTRTSFYHYHYHYYYKCWLLRCATTVAISAILQQLQEQSIYSDRRSKHCLQLSTSTAKSFHSRGLRRAPEHCDSLQPMHVLSLPISRPTLSRDGVSLPPKCAKSIVFRASSAHRFYGGEGEARVMEWDNFATVL